MKLMIEKSFLFCAAALMLVAPSLTHAQSSPDALAKLTQDLCARPDLYGYTRNAQGGVDGHLNIPLLQKRLVDLGLSAKIDAAAADWKGIPQNQLAASVSDYRQCTQNTLKILLGAYAPRPLANPSVSHHSRQSHHLTTPPQSPIGQGPTTTNNCSVIGGTINAATTNTCNIPPKN